MTDSQALGPIGPEQRVEEIDMMRGFALFGVLLVNMFNFGAYSLAWTAPIDEFAFWVMRFFFETKSWRLFSFLFALGFSLQLLRAEQTGVKFLPVYLRRLALLFVFGMAHALFYTGDILMLFAELGLVLMAFRKVPPRVLLVVAGLLLAVFSIGRAATTTTPEANASVNPAAAPVERAMAQRERDRQTHPYAVGSLREIWAKNVAAIPENPLENPLGPESGLARFAMFLLGLYVGRRGILRDIPRHWRQIRRVCGWGMGLGLLAMVVERFLHVTTGYNLFRPQQATVLPQFVGDVVFTYGATALSLGYAATIIVLAQRRTWRRILCPLGAVGRMALTNYLSGTLMFTTLFYSYGFGQAFRIGPAKVLSYACLFFAIQIAMSVWWTRHFRFGPAEWLWRSATYWKWQPMRVDSAPAATGAAGAK